MNKKVKLLPFRFTPVYVAGNKNVTPDCLSRRTDSPVLPIPAAPPINLLDIANVEAGYCHDFGPPTWVSDHLPAATLAHMVKTQPTLQEHQEAEILEHLVKSLDLPSVEALEDRSAIGSIR